jgi:excisionase family DNA binding protein
MNAENGNGREAPKKRYLTTDEFLKYKVSMGKTKLYALIKKGEIKASKLGREFYIDQYDFDMQMFNKRST